MNRKKFDLAVLGAGPGGYPAAIRAAQSGKSVALIEANEIGGTCLNRGCIPSKALIAGAEFLLRLKDADRFGIDLSDPVFDYTRLALHKDRTVDKMRAGLAGLIEANRITLIKGFGKFQSPREIKVTGPESLIVEAETIIIATGSEPRNIPAFPFDGERIHSSTSLLNITRLPKKIAIIGGGVIGCEFASLFANLDVDVTILELLPRILSTEAEDVSSALVRAFTKKRIGIETGIRAQKIEYRGEGIVISAEGGLSFDADCCLVAVGRSLNTREIGLEKAGIDLPENGVIPVDDKMETPVKGIYAVGDITSTRWWLAHVATHQGLIAADNACGKHARMDYRAIPSVIFTHPEIGSVGLSPEEALKSGYKIKKGSFPFAALGKSQATLESDGFAQTVVDEKTGRILGAQVVGYEASSLIAEMVLAISSELTIESISETIHAHPTIGEIWGEVAFSAQGFPLSSPPLKSKHP